MTFDGWCSHRAHRLRNVTNSSLGVTAYQGLHAYLNGRYADRLVMTFKEIEDLLGFALPDAARVRVGWWTDDTADGGESPQSHAWTHAGRSAKPNLFARTVVFERVSA
jgi:hypothetical protein